MIKQDMSDHFVAKKSLGQNFLTSNVVPLKMCAAADLIAGDTVLEIGPGTGVLTKQLLATGAHVIAVETDPRAIELLTPMFKAELANRTLVLIDNDVRYLDLKALPLQTRSYKVVANIPYYLSGFLLRTLLEHEIQPSCIVFLMQKEVVERIARDKKESILSLSVKAFGTPKYVATVKKGHFNPQPKVDSAILSIKDITRENFDDNCPMELFFSLLHLGFGQKRKQMLSNLSKIYDRTALDTIFLSLSIPPTIRAEALPLPQWLALTRAIALLK